MLIKYTVGHYRFVSHEYQSSRSDNKLNKETWEEWMGQERIERGYLHNSRETLLPVFLCEYSRSMDSQTTVRPFLVEEIPYWAMRSSFWDYREKILEHMKSHLNDILHNEESPSGYTSNLYSPVHTMRIADTHIRRNHTTDLWEETYNQFITSKCSEIGVIENRLWFWPVSQ